MLHDTIDWPKTRPMGGNSNIVNYTTCFSQASCGRGSSRWFLFGNMIMTGREGMGWEAGGVG